MLKDRLVGTLELVNLETRRADGQVLHPYGKDVVGSFMFGPDGNYSVQLMGTEYMATWGTYVVDEDQQTFTLTVRGALDRSVIGTQILRHVNWGDDVAVFNTPTHEVDGVEAVTYITWRKVTPS